MHLVIFGPSIGDEPANLWRFRYEDYGLSPLAMQFQLGPRRSNFDHDKLTSVGPTYGRFPGTRTLELSGFWALLRKRHSEKWENHDVMWVKQS